MLWKKEWPHKPDVVAEGGNGSLDAAANVTVGPESLRMLTTSNNIARTLLAETGDTSAATAEVARLCAQNGGNLLSGADCLRAPTLRTYSRPVAGTVTLAPNTVGQHADGFQSVP